MTHCSRLNFKHEIICAAPYGGLDVLVAWVLYMSFDRFLFAVESCDLSQADRSIIRVSSFSILQNFNF